MTEQPPSAALNAALALLAEVGELDLTPNDIALAFHRYSERVCEQRVSAETDKLNAIIKYFVSDWREATYHCPPDPSARCARCDAEDVLPTYCGRGEKASAQPSGPLPRSQP